MKLTLKLVECLHILHSYIANQLSSNILTLSDLKTPTYSVVSIHVLNIVNGSFVLSMGSSPSFPIVPLSRERIAVVTGGNTGKLQTYSFSSLIYFYQHILNHNQ